MTSTVDFLRSVIQSANDAVTRLEEYPYLDSGTFKDEAQRLDREVGNLVDKITEAE